MAILEKIRTPDDVKKLNIQQLYRLCAEVRRFLVRNVAHTGGHLASNLGVVELTVALHAVFDTSVDRLVFDVGHQCYTHKILTGRRDHFKNLRAFDCLSGFPKPDESVHDAFATGHASTSVSAALGMARARTLQHKNHHVLSVIGDGALTGGLAYEGLCDAGQSGEPMIVILNDNGMSIKKNVGGMAKHLAHLRLRPQYLHLKKIYHRVLDPMPGGKQVDRFLTLLKTAVKDTLLPGSMFENMGFVYLGPTNGHDLNELMRLLRMAKALDKPVLLHITTTKGRGYAPSEHNPVAFHGVSHFDVKTGRMAREEPRNFSNVFGASLKRLAADDRRICAVTAAMTDGTGLSRFAAAYPRRFFDVGIAESHAVTMAAGLAKQGMRPVCAIYSTFLQRAYDQIIHDVALSGLPVTFAIDRAGLVGEDGETHHGIFDSSFLCHIPGMTVYTPASYAELSAMLRRAVAEDHPSAVRYPRGQEGRYRDCHLDTAILHEGKAVTLVTYGAMVNQALDAVEALRLLDVDVELIKLAALQPLTVEPIAASLHKTGKLTVLQDSVYEGSVAQRLLAGLCGQTERPFETQIYDLGDRFVPQGRNEDLYKAFGLDAESLAKRIRTFGV